MASTRINSIDLGPIWLQSGNGTPDHLAYVGTQYTDLNSALIYTNIDGLNTWSTLATTSVVPYDKYITGMTFNNGNYDLILNRNDGAVFTQSLAILASDMTVTGGTYNSITGSATFTNNSGGTFTVSGFNTGMTDSYTTGATLSNDIIHFNTNNQGLDFYNVNLTPSLSGKTNLSLFNSHTGNTNNPHQTSFSGLTSTAHTHSISDIVGLGDNLNTKYDKTGGTVSGVVTANSFIKSGGTANQFLKADGSSDNTNYQEFITSGLTTDYYRGDKIFQPLTTDVVTEVTNKHYVSDLDLVHLSGLSGINSGDNSVNLTSNAYADAKVQDIIVDGVSGIAPSQNVVYDKLLLKQNLPTGFISGLPLSIKPLDNTKAIIGNGVYAITDFSVLSAITVQLVSVTTPIEFSPAFLLTNPASYIALDINQNVIQSASPFTNEDRRTLALVGAVIHSNNININTTNEIKAPIVAPTNQLHDMIKAVGTLNLEGNIYSPNGANLQLNKSAGVIWGLGINASNFYNPHVLSLSAQTAFNFNYRLRNSLQYSGTTSIDPNNYDNAGILTVVPNNRYTIQRINLFQSGISILQYGQNIYQTLDEAKTFLSTESFVTEQNIGDNAIFRAYLIVKKGVTNLTTAVSSNDAFFVPVDKFGNVVGGGSLSTLQSAYDNSLTPEIVTNSSLGALSIRNGSGTPNASTKLFEGLNSGGTITSLINADGGISGSSISATTYYNLPTDIRVTGGTYSAGTTTFTNNTGGTFNVTGFSTASNFTGGTVSGSTNFINGLTANTISASSISTNGLLSGYNITDAQYKTVYNYTNGCLVEFDITNNFKFTYYQIIGHGNGSNILIQGSLYGQQTSIDTYRVSKIIGDVLDLSAFYYNGRLHIWFKQNGGNQTFSVFAWNGNGASITPNLNNKVVNITNVVKPTSGVTYETAPTITFNTNTTGLTANKIIKATGTSTFIDSNITDNGTVVTTSTDMNINGVTVGRGGGNINSNTAVGASSLAMITGGTKTVGLGFGAGRYYATSSPLTNANNCIYIGYFSKALNDSTTNEINIGVDINGLGSNTTSIGNSSTSFGRWWGKLLLGTSTNDGSLLRVAGTANINTLNLTNTTDTSTASTHYFVEIGSDGNVRPKTLANVRTEIVTTASVDAAKPNIVTGVLSSYNKLLKYGSNENTSSVASNLIDSGTLISSTTDMSINSIKVGRGGGNIANNTSLGQNALNNNVTSVEVVAVGNNAFSNGTNVSYSVAIGSVTGQFDASNANLTGLTTSTLIGRDSRPLANGDSNEVVIAGNQGRGLGSNTTVIGTSLTSYGRWWGKLLVGTSSNDGINDIQANGGIKAGNFRLSNLNTAPSSATDTGTLGEIRVTSTYIYVCTATNTWVRSPLSTW